MHDRGGEDAIERLSDAVALWSAGAGPASDVIDAAVQCLVDDVDSPALRELAGVSPGESRFILDPLIDQVLDELGVDRLAGTNSQHLRGHKARQLADKDAAGATRAETGYVFTTLTGKPVGPDRLTRLFPATGPYRRIRRRSRAACSPPMYQAGSVRAT